MLTFEIKIFKFFRFLNSVCFTEEHFDRTTELIKNINKAGKNK